MSATVLIIGSGGREHALAYGIAMSNAVDTVYVCPGNAGTARLSKTANVSLSVKPGEWAETIQFCKDKMVDLVVIGPEAPLVDGFSDALRAEGFAVFGASKAAAKLEGSKSYATAFMQRHGIAIPESRIVTSREEARAAMKEFGGPTKAVIKADGLAGGKGVFLPDDEAEAEAAIEKIINGLVDGDGSTFVIQERNHGPEVSVFVLSDGESYQIIPLASQDHKRLGVGDTGPNTGGMGVYAPLPEWMLGPEKWQKITAIAQASIEGMRSEGNPYQGVLYMGLMLAEERSGDPIVIEYNARFGDPETEVIIPLLHARGVDIYEVLHATALGDANRVALPQSFGAALTICLAAENYPNSPTTGDIIEGLDRDYPNVVVFHGGTKIAGDAVATAGGRVLYVTGFSDTLEEASRAANAAIGEHGVHFKAMQYRSDIGYRALSPRNSNNS